MYAIRSYYVLQLGAENEIILADYDTAPSVTARKPRITSYNVCYTKLLRQALKDDQQEGGGLAGPGLGRSHQKVGLAAQKSRYLQDT